MTATAGYANLCEAFQSTAARFESEVALRTPGGTVELTWGEYRERVERIACGFSALGVGPGDTVGLMLTNRPEFHLLDTALLHLGATPFCVYNTSAVAQIRHLFRNAGNAIVVAEAQFMPSVRLAADASTAVKQFICVDEQQPATLTLAELEQEGLAGIEFERLWQAVSGDQIATLIYTSGTTGPPKGAMLSHRNMLAAWRAGAAAAPVLAERGRYISYLPTAHLADRMFSHYPALVNGSVITCVPDLRQAVALLPEIRPTVWLAVPRIWEKLKDAIEAGFDVEQTGLKDASLLLSGSAPIRPDVIEFYAQRGIEICEGYGMTESSGVASLNPPGATLPGTVGHPLPGVELKLAGDGEILLRGEVVMCGYRGDPEQTAQAIDPDGWLHTGDVGKLDEHGRLSIVDRKKELIINAAGKNMSPANIEAALKAASSLIAHAVAIGDQRPYNTALLVLDPDALNLWAYQQGITDQTPQTLAARPEIQALIETAVEQANTHLSRVEQIKRFTIVPDQWQPDGKLVTQTLKLKRRPIAEHYADAIEAMYPG